MKTKDTEAVGRIVRLTAYLPSEDFKRLRLELVRRGMTITAWVRAMIYLDIPQ